MSELLVFDHGAKRYYVLTVKQDIGGVTNRDISTVMFLTF